MIEQTCCPDVSFIIPHRGRIDYLISTMQSIEQQIYPHESIKLLILTQDKLIDLQGKLPKCSFDFKIFECDPSKTISSIRNFGVELTDTPYLAFVDADVFLSPDWTTSMVDVLKNNPKVILTAAKQRGSDKQTIVEKIRVSIGNTEGGVFVSSLPGHNLFLSREAYYKVKGFPEHLKTCEDYFFTTSLAELGCLYIAKTGWYIHNGEDRTFSQVFQKEYWRASSNLLSLRNRKVRLHEYPSIILPFWFLFAIIVLFIGLFSCSLSKILIGLLMYLLPIIYYSYRLIKKSADCNWLYIFYYYLLYHTSRSFGSLMGLLFACKGNFKR